MFLTGTGFAGACTPFASAAFTVCAGVNVAVDPSGNVNVVEPSFPTTIVVASGLAFFTASFTASFSGCVKLDGFLTGVTAGATALMLNTEVAASVSVLPSL